MHHSVSDVHLALRQWMAIVSVCCLSSGISLRILAAVQWQMHRIKSTLVQLLSSAGEVLDHHPWIQSASSSLHNKKDVANRLCSHTVIAHQHIASWIPLLKELLNHLYDPYAARSRLQRWYCVRRNSMPFARTYLRTARITKNPLFPHVHTHFHSS